MNRSALIIGVDERPLKVVSFERAVCHYLSGKMDPVAYSDVVFHSPSTSVQVPSILRVRKWVDLPEKQRSILLTTQAVLKRDNYECAYCGHHADTVDHIVPRSRKGAPRHVWINVIASCKPCNQRKKNRTPEEAGMKLRFQPFRPVRRWTEDPRPEWLPYLGEEALSA